MTSKETKISPSADCKEDTIHEYFLVLHNDDVHSFDYVIEALMEICEHDYDQAAQCTFIVHYKGKCDIRKGSFEQLKAMKDALMKKELNATIN